MALTLAGAAALLNHYLNNANHANIGDAAGLLASAGAGNLYISLHTADPTNTGNQTSNECAYTNYARQPVSRAGSGFDVVNANGSNAGQVTFPQSGSGPETATHFGIGTDVSGTGNLLFFGALSNSLVINSGITPQFNANELDIDVGTTLA